MKITLDLSKKSWTFDISEISKNYSHSDEIFIDFTNNGNTYVEFKDLSFGFVLKKGEDVLYDISFPPENVIYISTDQDYLESYYIEGFDPEIEYTLDVWAINNGQNFSDSISFIMPKPKQPAPMWEWDDESNVWIPPIDSARIGLIIDDQMSNG